MAICVGELFSCVPSKVWPWKKAAHMFSDSYDVDGLHAFAQSIGLKRSWFQNHSGSMPHYDVTANKRKEALAKGALSLGMRGEAAVVRAHRNL